MKQLINRTRVDLIGCEVKVEYILVERPPPFHLSSIIFILPFMATADWDNVSLIFVYGTLKRGFYNHTLIEDLGDSAAYVGPFTTVEAFPLVCGPHGIPFLVNLPGSGHKVRGELYSVSSGLGLSRLDQLEGVEQGHYQRLPVAVEGGAMIMTADAYFAHTDFGEALWKRCGQLGLTEYSLEMGSKYVRKEYRPPNLTFLQHIHNFISDSNY